MLKYAIVDCDVLIIGSGASGLRTAIEVFDSGFKNVVIVGKCRKGDAHTIEATGGINAALGTMDPEDSWLIHAADTLREGKFLADYNQVVKLCRQAPYAIFELVKWGAKFHLEKDGRLTQRFFGAHTYRRTCFHGDQTGKEIMRVLVNQTNKRKMKFYENLFIFRLLKKKNKIIGALGIDFKKGKIIVFKCKAIVLATGGYSRIYSRSSSRWYEGHGDGIKLAYDVDANLVNMEMVQFHPTGMVWPPKAQGILVTEAVRAEGGKLWNSQNERFMKNYDPQRMELGPRDLVARAIYNEIHEGRGTSHNAIFLDVTSLPKKKILDRLPKMYAQFKKLAKLDISKDKMEIAPTAHYTMGGIDTDEKGMTNIKGLYAVGEVTGQIHGANRLGGNSLVETIVFGRLVGEEISKSLNGSSSSISPSEIKNAIRKLYRKFGKSNVDVDDFRKEIQDTMWKYVGILKNETDLKIALKNIMKYKNKINLLKVSGSLKNNSKLKTLLEIENMLIVCEMVIKSALLRKESRGAHYRSDHPKQNDKWLVNILARKSGSNVKLFTRKVPRIKGVLIKLLKKVNVSHKHLE